LTAAITTRKYKNKAVTKSKRTTKIINKKIQKQNENTKKK
jgi:hypothetical protein